MNVVTEIENDWCYIQGNYSDENIIKVNLTPIIECPQSYESFSTSKNTYFIEKLLYKSNVSKIYLVHTHSNSLESESTVACDDKDCEDCKKYIIKKYHKDAIKQAKNEYKILKKLNSNLIISIVDKDLKNGILVMNKYSQDMFDLLITCQTNAKKLSKHSLKKYFTEMIDAIFYLHSHDIAHSDIKPENVLLTNDHHILFIDFGFAKLMKSKKAYKAKGTPFYAAPELRNHDEGFDAFKADIWALGMTLYLLLERRRPFNLDSLQKEAEVVTAEKVWDLIDNEDLIFFSKNDVHDVYNEYRFLISNMLEKKPKKRWDIYEIKAENDKINKRKK